MPDRTRVYWLLPGMDRRIGFAETVNGTNTFYYYLTDQVGTVLRIVKEDGTVVNQYDYDAFGRVRWNSPNTYENGVENRYLFQGREWDKHGGFYYFRNRIYLPERGEFASPDMNLGRGILGELDGMATLTFCGGDPVNCIDPTGLANEIVATIDGVNVGRVLNANDYAVINASANGPVQFGTESFEIYEANAGAVVTSTKVMLGSSYVVGETAAGIFIPGVGEAMDASVLADPESGKWEKRIAGASLSLGLMTGGAMPNIGRPVSRGIRFVKGLFKKGGKVVSGVDNQLSSVVRLQPSTAGAGVVENSKTLIRSSLPDLKGSVREAFEGTPRLRTFKTGERVYRTPNLVEDVLEPFESPGPWLSTRRTTTKKGTQSQLNVLKWANPLEEMRTYEFTKDVTVYYGKVSGGKGYQILIPRDVNPEEILHFVERISLK